MRAEDEPLSPELALVDPEAAARARSALPEIVLTETLLEASRPARSPTHPAPQTIEADVREQPLDQPPSYEDIFRIVEELAAEAPRRRRNGYRMVAAVAGAAIVVSLVLLETPRLGLRSSRSAVPQGSATAAALPPQEPAASIESRTTVVQQRGTTTAPETPAIRLAPSPSSPPTSSTSRRHIPDFVWARDERAHGYSVEFRIGSKIVYRAQARVERLRVAPSRLRPGTYRWIVWRLDRDGKRIGTPLVDSSLTIG